jgi:hypothetical protein
MRDEMRMEGKGWTRACEMKAKGGVMRWEGERLGWETNGM